MGPGNACATRLESCRSQKQTLGWPERGARKSRHESRLKVRLRWNILADTDCHQGAHEGNEVAGVRLFLQDEKTTFRTSLDARSCCCKRLHNLLETISLYNGRYNLERWLGNITGTCCVGRRVIPFRASSTMAVRSLATSGATESPTRTRFRKAIVRP